MSFEARLGDSFAQTCNAAGNASGSGIAVGAFEAEYVELRVQRRTLNWDGALHFHNRFSLILVHESRIRIFTPAKTQSAPS